MGRHGTTATELHGLSETEFEAFGAAYLRQRHPDDCAALVHRGQNKNGRSINSRVDGFVRVPDTPVRLIAYQATVEKRKGLKGKWLGTPTQQGDIDKAQEEFTAWLGAEPDALCRLYLMVSYRLDGDDTLYTEATNYGRARGMEIIIIEGSALTDYLDHARDGQYLRKEYLAIAADRLSDGLLRDIGSLSLAAHRALFGGTEPRREITRDAHHDVVEALAQPQETLIGLLAAPGLGKSTLLRQVGEGLLARGDVAVWVRAEDVMAGTPLNTLLLTTFKRYYPTLDDRAGDDALWLASRLPGGLTLLVDDISRLPAPQSALQILGAWFGLRREATARSLGTQGQDTNAPLLPRATIKVVAPLWPGLIDPSNRSPSPWFLINLPPYSARECTEVASRLADARSQDVGRIIDALNGDPWLCGLLAPEQIGHVPVGGDDLLRTTLQMALERTIRTTMEASHPPATHDEVSQALDDLIVVMMRHQAPEPEWQLIKAELGGEALALLRAWAGTKQLGWISHESGQDRWRWKHERLRDAVLGRWLARNVLTPVVPHGQAQASTASEAWLRDPGLAEAWALALAFVPDPARREEALSLIAQHNPLALVEVLRLNLFPHAGAPRQVIQDSLGRALFPKGVDETYFVSGPVEVLLERLCDTIHPLVLDVTQDMDRRWWGVLAARLRNGDAEAGLTWIEHTLRREGFPSWIRNTFVEQSLAAFMDQYDTRRTELATELFAREQEHGWAASLFLAGYVAWPELARPLCQRWTALSRSDKLDVLLPALWALSRCCGSDEQAELEQTLLLLRDAEFPEDDPTLHNNATTLALHFLSDLRGAVPRWPFTAPSVETWVKVAGAYPDLCQPLCYVLSAIDHPAAMEFYVRWSSALEGLNLWALTDRTRDPGHPHNAETRAALWHIVLYDTVDATRRVAFDYWQRASTSADLEHLRSVDPSDQLFDDALQLRAYLRDKTAAPLLIDNIGREPGAWCRHGAYLYHELGVAEAVLDHLDAALREMSHNVRAWGIWWIGQDLPPEGVRAMVRRHRSVLLGQPETWTALWRSGVPEALQLVHDAIASAEPDDLKHFCNRSTNFPFPVTQTMLDALVPVLGRFPPSERVHLAELALGSGCEHWVHRYLPETLTAEESWLFRRTERGMCVTLDTASAAVPQGLTAVYNRLGSLLIRDEAWVSWDKVRRALHAWIAPGPRHEQVIIAAMLTAVHGTSSDLGWWQALEPDDPALHVTWTHTLYRLKRRRWHE